MTTIRETILDLDTVTLARCRPVSVETQARLNLNEMAEFRRACRDEERRFAFRNVVEIVGAFGDFKLEAFGDTREAVEGIIADYHRRGPNSGRFNIRFFPIRADQDGGYVAHGRASREAY